MLAIDNSSLADRLAQAFACESNASLQQKLELIGELLVSWNTDGIPLDSNPGGVQTPSFTTAVISGTVAAGAKSVSFTTSADWVGTILGTTFPANSSIGFYSQEGHSLDSLAYTRAAGTLYIAKTV
jgi:hypothetical protein